MYPPDLTTPDGEKLFTEALKTLRVDDSAAKAMITAYQESKTKNLAVRLRALRDQFNIAKKRENLLYDCKGFKTQHLRFSLEITQLKWAL